MTRSEVLAKALDYDCPLVELTGGEPLLQPDVFPLMTELCDAGKTVLLETSGAHDIGEVDSRVHIILDLKCPDSGESHRNRWANLDVLKPTDQIKFVLASRRDSKAMTGTIVKSEAGLGVRGLRRVRGGDQLRQRLLGEQA